MITDELIPRDCQSVFFSLGFLKLQTCLACVVAFDLPSCRASGHVPETKHAWQLASVELAQNLASLFLRYQARIPSSKRHTSHRGFETTQPSEVLLSDSCWNLHNGKMFTEH
jgi:hypothetical protein